jgi:hypothetical protein
MYWWGGKYHSFRSFSLSGLISENIVRILKIQKVAQSVALHFMCIFNVCKQLSEDVARAQG